MKKRLLFAPLAVALLLAAIVFAPAGASAAAAKPCSASKLVVWAGEEPGGGAAGSVYYRIEFTNLGGSSCTLEGAPTVSAVGLAGAKIGAPARLETGKAKPVTLATGDTAVATLRIVEALDFPKAKCKPTYAAGLRISVPGGSGSKVAPLAFQTCASTSSKTLSVAPVSASS